MQFTTQIPIFKTKSPIDYNSKIILLGSCFVENMGEKLSYFKFQNTINPFGIIFNAVSIEKLMYRAVNFIEFTEKDIFFYNDLWHCYEVHSELSNPDKEKFLEILNERIQSTNKQISEASHLIITYGTSWVYKEKKANQIVANCHKVPQKEFEKVLLSAEENQHAIQNTLLLIQQLNSDCKITITISPVRHIKDGFIENQVSKANLITTVYGISKRELFKQKALEYFPSYEIVMDELRDYRFYAEDMLHPNVTATRYIWKLFKENYISENTFSVIEEIDTIQKSLLHKPFNPNSESHLKFVAKLHEKISTLVTRYPHIQFKND
ncbi:GSCFA domain-containing protein [Flavobacterium sp. TAB 87]|uniref:GSCFA domain-containing protein n=1 Tax=Flavobacterium sp. TAB 87 TaxID=1729581 RepID=UPI00076DA894|nr:GSCFA domain-containing protein [Flavobacterium sp. TAB 87]KVV14279.1 GSCFA family protein [Flavobacterium sp. TAB 87]